MIDAERIETESADESRKLAWLVSAASIILLLVFFYAPLNPLRLPLTLLIPILLALGMWIAFRLSRKSPLPAPLVPNLLGMFFVLGGIGFDLLMTYVKTPTLERESNPVARTLLDAGFSVWFVIAYGLVAQSLLCGLVTLLWAGFLKHRAILLASAARGNPSSTLLYIKAALGARDLTWRQALFPLKFSELPDAYHYVWFGVCLAVSLASYRWALGFAWLEMLSWTMTKLLAVLAAVLGTVAYIYWLISSRPVNRQS